MNNLNKPTCATRLLLPFRVALKKCRDALSVVNFIVWIAYFPFWYIVHNRGNKSEE